MTSYGSNLSAKDIVCTDLTSKGVIHWTEFQPPLGGTPGAPVPGLTLVLGAGNDAGTEPIQDVSRLTFQKKAGETQSEIVGEANPKTLVTNCDLSSATNVHPTGLTQDLSSVLTQGNTANTAINMNGKELNNCNGGTISNMTYVTSSNFGVVGAGTILASSASAIQLAATTFSGDLNLQAPNGVKSSINNTNIVNADTVNCKNVVVTGTAADSEGNLIASTQINAPIINVTPNSGGGPLSSKLVFNAAITNSQLIGSSSTNPTKVTNCDFSSSTNVTNERFLYYQPVTEYIKQYDEVDWQVFGIGIYIEYQGDDTELLVTSSFFIERQDTQGDAVFGLFKHIIDLASLVTHDLIYDTIFVINNHLLLCLILFF